MVENYSTYQFHLKERIWYSIQGGLAIVLLGLVFYQSFYGIILLCPLIFPYFKRKKYQLIETRKWQLNLEFRDGIHCLSAALCAGYSAEQAFEEALKDLNRLYKDKESSFILKEFSYLVNQMKMNITVEMALYGLGERSGVEDIISFAEVFSTAKRTGGDLIKVIRTTCNTISDKIEVKREIITLITSKRFEANIMKMIPLGILCYLYLTSPNFLNPLYHNILGIVIMTFLLGFYIVAFLLIDKIIAIEV